ncbi:SDR family oxidoreductase [Eubacteriaceae bacterium ES2]|nr:SDR family oxidoreductase [Eubacteriaceae bacterium ES2]
MKNQEVVLVTGCSSGVGRDICKILSNMDYTVVATARNIDALTNVSAELKLELDVTDRESIHKAVDRIIQQFHKIDILVNNAGYSVRGAIEEIDLQEVKKMFDVNVFGIMNLVQAVLPEMRKEKNGKIINIGSVSGKFTQAVNGGYCASKHALEAISDALRLELQQYHIQSTVIEPGPMQTNFFKTLAKNSNHLLEKRDSAYITLHKADLEYRNKQKRSDSNESARRMCKIITSKKLKPRYKVAVPLAFRILLRFPDSLKEYLLLRY